ncbi:MAG: two-component sensor histidine kinase [Alphaproteobacteria bacterium]|nr:MAG: two-component sensor histidine kinase [Alphaproteobacteria bacterium]
MFQTVSRALNRNLIYRTIRRRWRAFFQWLKPYFPRTLFGRSILILVLPVVLMQVVTTYIYMERYSELVTRRLSAAVAGELANAITLIGEATTALDQQRVMDLMKENQGLEISFESNTSIPSSPPFLLFSLLSDTVGSELRSQIDYPLWYDTTKYPSHVEIQVQLGEDVMVVKVRRSRILATNWHIFLVWLGFFSVIFLTISILFLKNQIRPIQRLAIAAEGFGKGRDVPDFRPSGATEVRGAAIAFIDMKNRLNSYVTQRTEMLAGVSHDLRTPITRMKLQLAMMGNDEAIEDLKSDLAEMEYMLDEYLAFAQSDTSQSSETSQETDLMELLSEIQSDAARKDQKVEVRGPDQFVMPLRRLAMKRCITNLVNNACTYGTRASVRVTEQPNNWVEIEVSDNGPGIPEARREEAFLPFHRLDVGRNLDSGGSGLGLAIARDAARAHGGEITLGEAASGGLKATISLPT